ncbi:carboxypeptidase-like regulatory domain-containing protein [Phocaeicola abscessus]
MKKLFPILYCLFTGIVGIFAQEREVRGVVLSTDNAPVIQASVVVSGQRTIGTSTDRDGNFVLKVPANANYLKGKDLEQLISRNSGENAKSIAKTEDAKEWQFVIPYDEIKGNNLCEQNEL